MIDTSKYEGHPPAPWGWRHKVAVWRLTADGDKEWIDGIRVDEDTDPTVMALIADAPLLLAEVKRLREMLYIAEQNIPRRIHWDCYVNALIEAGFEEGEEE